MPEVSRSLTPAAAVMGVAGLLLAAAAALLSPSEIEMALTGRPGSLSWGPALFRGLLAFHALLLLGAAVLYRPQPSLPAVPRTRPAVWWTLVGLSIIALALRLWRLDTGLWLDEVHTMVDYANVPLTEVITRFGASKNQHILYSLLAHFSMRLFGETAWALRLPAALFGVASLWSMFLLGRRIIGVGPSLLACALMTVSYHHIWFSQNARGYIGLLFFAMLATWLWIEGMERPTWRTWTLYAVFAFLGVWMQLTMVFVLAAHGLIWLGSLVQWRRLDPRLRWMPPVALFLAGTLTLQAFALVLPQFLGAGMHEPSATNTDWTNPLWLITESLHSLRIGFSGATAVLAGGIMLFAGWISLFRKNKGVAIALVLPVIVAAVIAVAAAHNLFPRYFFFAMGFALLILVHGAMKLSEFVFPAGSRWRPRAGMAIVFLMILVSAATVPRCYALPKQDFIGARDFAQSQSPGQPVVAVGTARLVYQRYYAPHWLFPQTAAELEEARRRHPNLLLVYTLPIHMQVFEPEIWRIVETHFEPLREFPGTLNGGEVFVCRQSSAAAARVLEPASR